MTAGVAVYITGTVLPAAPSNPKALRNVGTVTATKNLSDRHSERRHEKQKKF
jgi:hypothetical protein